jgi:hypothetical protein
MSSPWHTRWYQEGLDLPGGISDLAGGEDDCYSDVRTKA